MKIHFSQWLDGYIPHLPLGKAVMAEAWVGPRGLLERLEAGFGVDGSQGAEPERVDAYARRIERCVEGDAFYFRSWEIDPWGVARELLSWRDGLVMAGWDGSAVADGGLRLEALAAVEAQCDVVLPDGFADRLRRVDMALDTGRDTGIEEVHLIEPRGDLPCVWQRVIGALGRSGTRIIEPCAPEPVADPGTDLGLLQRALVEGTTLPKGLVQGDGSLLLVSGRSPSEAGEGFAAWLRQLELGAWPLQPVVVRGAAPVVLDEALARFGVPTLGASSSSPWRPALQVLPLALSMLWAPRNPQRALELLSLPVSPLSRRLRTALLKALNRAPGIGGAAWDEAWQGVAANSEAPGDVECQVKEWLERPVFEPSAGVPVGVVREIADRVADWARNRASSMNEDGDEAEAETLATAAAQARQLSGILDGRGNERLERTQLDQLLQDVTRSGSARRVSNGLSGSVPCFSHPGAVLAHNSHQLSAAAGDAQHPAPSSHIGVLNGPSSTSPRPSNRKRRWAPHLAGLATKPGENCGPGEADAVVWWGFVASSAGAARRPVWRAAERRALAAVGVELDEPSALQRGRSAAWMRPLLAARERLLLVSIETLNGEVESPHPVWDEICGHLKMSDSDLAKVSVDWRDALSSGGGSAHIKLPEQAREVVPAVAGQAVWAVDESLLPPRSKESASSLESLLGCPLRWGLKYRAKLRPGAIGDLPADNLLFGSLAHTLIEEFLIEHSDSLPEPAAARAMFEERFDDGVEGEAATLLQPDQAETLQRVRYQIARAGEVLVGAIRGGGFQVEGCEVEVSDARFADTGFSGFIDLLLSHPQHGEVVVDLKWGGWTYREKQLKDGHALQLALYANAVRKNGRALPPTAFFVLSEARFLTLHHGLFDPAVVVEGPSMEATISAAKDTYAEVRNELDAGELIVPPLLDQEPLLAEGREGQPLALEPPCTFCDFGGICGIGLDGAS